MVFLTFLIKKRKNSDIEIWGCWGKVRSRCLWSAQKAAFLLWEVSARYSGCWPRNEDSAVGVISSVGGWNLPVSAYRVILFLRSSHELTIFESCCVFPKDVTNHWYIPNLLYYCSFRNWGWWTVINSPMKSMKNHQTPNGLTYMSTNHWGTLKSVTKIRFCNFYFASSNNNFYLATSGNRMVSRSRLHRTYSWQKWLKPHITRRNKYPPFVSTVRIGGMK